jgi:hypothetical protein
MITAFRIILLVIVLNFSAKAQNESRVLPADKIIELIPNKFEDFSMNTDPQGKLIALGTLKYSMVEKNFIANRKRSIKILLFDFSEALIMYNQATRKFDTISPVDNDSLVFLPLFLEDGMGSESYNAKKNFSQIMLGVCGRFFLTIEGTNVELSELKRIVDAFKFDTFPKLVINNPKSR